MKRNYLIPLFLLNCLPAMAQDSTASQFYYRNHVPLGMSYTPRNPFPDQQAVPENPLQAAREQQQRQIAQQNAAFTGQATAVNRKQQTQQVEAQINNEFNESERNAARYESEREKDKEYFNSPGFAEATKPYKDALQAMKDMLSGKIPLSVCNAYYVLESAYGNSYLSYKDFKTDIHTSARFIRQWMKEHHLNEKDNENLNYAIQRFMGDTLAITVKPPDSKGPARTITHLPFRYDYVDFTGETDFRDYFVTKCMSTGYGQCSSMPAVYMCLAETLGARAYLSTAPLHSFIKYPDDAGYLHNYEVTTNCFVTDKWYQDYFYIQPQAMLHGIYLDTMNRRQIVADCMVELAHEYMKKFGVADGRFIMDCLNSSTNEFPKPYHLNIETFLLYSAFLARLVGRELDYDHARDISDTLYNDSAKYYFDMLWKNEHNIANLGYEDFPEQRYVQLMKIDTAKARNQLYTKQPRSLFIEQ